MLRGRGEIRCARLETSELEPTCFDVITLWDVLEHVPDPVAFLSSCNSHLKEGGTLLLNVPHIDSIVAKVFGSRWPLLLPEHLSYFSRRSVEVCAKEAGLEVIRLRQRPAYFSLSHVLHRMGEHRIPAARKIRDLVRWVGLGELVTPIYLGELLAILRKPP
jgi:SAM-dependent methyltransferase